MDKSISSDLGLSQDQYDAFKANGFLNLGKILSDDDVESFTNLFDHDHQRYPYMWHQYGHHQHANYDALVSSPAFDDLIRHPAIYQKIVALFGGPVCFGEIGLRWMGSYAGQYHQSWHRDRGYWFEHPLRLDYMQLIVYLTEVNESTHCFSISPEDNVSKPCKTHVEQIERRGTIDLHGPAGTCALFNVALFHTATTRPTEAERKTVQIYYGHLNRKPLANDSGIPLTLSQHPDDHATRSFYGNLNERSQLYMKAYNRDIEPQS